MRILNEKKINLNRKFSYNPLKITAGMEMIFTSLANAIGNESKKSTLLMYAYDDGKEPRARIFKGGIIADELKLYYKLTEELDSAVISLIDSGDDKSNTLDYKMPNRTRIFLKYDFSPTNKTFNFSEDEGPLDYDDYVVVGSNFVEKNDHFFHGYQIVEPTYLFRLQPIETNTFTNLESIEITDASGTKKTYTQPATNALSALERILKIAGMKDNKGDTTWFSRIYIPPKLKARLRNNGLKRDYAYNSCSLYDIVFKIFSIIDCYPELHFNPNYDPNSEEESKREFVLIGTSTLNNGIVLDGNEVFKNATAFSVSDLSEKHATQVVTEVQNMRSSLISNYPSRYIGRVALTSTIDNLNVAVNYENIKNLTLKVSNPICEGYSVEAQAWWKNRGDDDANHLQKITIGLISKEQWAILSEEEQWKYAYFEEGSNEVHVGHLFSNKNSNISFIDFPIVNRICFKVAYYSYLNLKVRNGDEYGYQTSVAQIESKVDSRLFGKFMDEYINKNSGISIQFGKIFLNYSDIYKTGSIVKSEYGNLVITDTEITVKNNCYQVAFSLNQEIPTRSNIIDFGSLIENKFIDFSKLQKRAMNFYEQLKLGISTESRPLMWNEKSYSCKSNMGKLFFAPYLYYFDNSKFDLKKVPTNAYMKLQWTTNNVPTTKYVRYPLDVSAYGTSILFNINFESNLFHYAAGVFQITSLNLADDASMSTILNRYASPFGKIDKIDILLANEDSSKWDKYIANDLDNMGDNSVESFQFKKEWQEMVNDFITTFPYIEQSLFETVSNYSAIKVTDAEILKDTYEALNITMQINVVPENTNIKVYPAFIENSGIYGNALTRLYVYKGISSSEVVTDEITEIGNYPETNLTNASYDEEKLELTIYFPETTSSSFTICSGVNPRKPLFSVKFESEVTTNKLVLKLIRE